MLRREEKCSMASHYSTANIDVSEIMVLSCLYIYIYIDMRLRSTSSLVEHVFCSFLHV